MSALWNVFYAMKIFLAGTGVAIVWAIEQGVRLFLAGTKSRPWMVEDMKLYLAESGGLWNAYLQDNDFAGVYILQSFYYMDDRMASLIPQFGDFLLDSGAFTFMAGSHGGKIIWEEYADKYADFVNRHHVDKFFELDIDSLVGYQRVKELRNRIEKATGKQTIPVWHKSRGKEEFSQMCAEYPYVALGGIVSKEWRKEEYGAFPYFIKEAHRNGAKIHGLGFTQLEGLKKYHFDSVDSTTWTSGNRFGCIYSFDGETMQKQDAPAGKRLADARKAALHNFCEWVKFQRYAEVHL